MPQMWKYGPRFCGSSSKPLLILLASKSHKSLGQNSGNTCVWIIINTKRQILFKWSLLHFSLSLVVVFYTKLNKTTCLKTLQKESAYKSKMSEWYFSLMVEGFPECCILVSYRYKVMLVRTKLLLEVLTKPKISDWKQANVNSFERKLVWVYTFSIVTENPSS